MTLIRWNPAQDLASIEIDRLNRMFESAFTGEPMGQGGWVPAVDIYETAQNDVVVKVELPEVKREDIKLTFENQVLTIEGKRELESPADGRYTRLERGHGAFRRSFALPATVDGARVSATNVDGVLTITMPRREETRPRQIPIGG